MEEEYFSDQECLDIIYFFLTSFGGISTFGLDLEINADISDLFYKLKRIKAVTETEDDWYELNNKGFEIVHVFIEKTSKKIISMLNEKLWGIPVDEFKKWFSDYSQITDETNLSIIIEYLLNNLHNYGYKVNIAFNRRLGRRYVISPINK